MAPGIKLDTSSAAFRDVWRGIRRTHAVPANKKAPLLTAGLRRATLPDTLAGRRDRAMLLIGFGAALRRSELAGLEVAQREGRVAVRGRRLQQLHGHDGRVVAKDASH
jgi:site-specific recombinase XerC